MLALRLTLLAAALSALAACSSASAGSGTTPADGGATSPGDGGGTDGARAVDAACTGLHVDDAGVTHGCGGGGMGVGDHDDGGGMMAPPSDASPDAKNLPFGASCLNNAQCASGVCFLYKVKGTFCTNACTTNADCPVDVATGMSVGCNGMGVCRVPDPPKQGGDGGGGGDGA